MNWRPCTPSHRKGLWITVLSLASLCDDDALVPPAASSGSSAADGLGSCGWATCWRISMPCRAAGDSCKVRPCLLSRCITSSGSASTTPTGSKTLGVLRPLTTKMPCEASVARSSTACTTRVAVAGRSPLNALPVWTWTSPPPAFRFTDPRNTVIVTARTILELHRSVSRRERAAATCGHSQVVGTMSPEADRQRMG